MYATGSLAQRRRIAVANSRASAGFISRSGSEITGAVYAGDPGQQHLGIESRGVDPRCFQCGNRRGQGFADPGTSTDHRSDRLCFEAAAFSSPARASVNSVQIAVHHTIEVM